MIQPVRKPVAAVQHVARGIDLHEVQEAVEPRDPGKSGLFLLPSDDLEAPRFQQNGRVVASFAQVVRIAKASEPSMVMEDPTEEIPIEFRHLIGHHIDGTNFAQPMDPDEHVHDFSMGDSEDQFARMLDAHG